MIGLSFRTINDNEFHHGLNKLASFTGFAPKDAYHVGRIADLIGQHTRQARIEYGKLIEKYAAKDELGKPITTQAPPFFQMKEGTTEADWNKDYNSFLEITVEVAKNKIPLSSLPSNVGLSAKELKALEALIDAEEEEPSNVIPMTPPKQ